MAMRRLVSAAVSHMLSSLIVYDFLLFDLVSLVIIHCVPKKVSPLNILQQPTQTCTDLNEILHTQDDIYFCHRRQIS